MKYTSLILFIAVFFVAKVDAQYQKSDIDAIQFLKEFFKAQIPGDKELIYTDYLSKRATNALTKAFTNNDTIRKWVRKDSNSLIRTAVDSIILSSDEKQYLLKKIESLKDIVWADSLFKNSKLVSEETISHIFKEGGWTHFHETIGASYYSFSKPIFLRNNSICFFYYECDCGKLCGEAKLTVYKKENNAWTLFSILFEWIS